MRAHIAFVMAALLLPQLLLAVDSGRWKDNGNQTLTDTFTGLVWTRHDNLKDINQLDAKRYCDTLSLAGAHWRLPEIDELEGIYSGGADGTTSCNGGAPCKVSSLFYLTGPWFWSATDAGEDSYGAWAWYLYLTSGNRGRNSVDYTSYHRALCVRRS